MNSSLESRRFRHILIFIQLWWHFSFCFSECSGKTPYSKKDLCGCKRNDTMPFCKEVMITMGSGKGVDISMVVIIRYVLEM